MGLCLYIQNEFKFKLLFQQSSFQNFFYKIASELSLFIVIIWFCQYRLKVMVRLSSTWQQSLLTHPTTQTLKILTFQFWDLLHQLFCHTRLDMLAFPQTQPRPLLELQWKSVAGEQLHLQAVNPLTCCMLMSMEQQTLHAIVFMEESLQTCFVPLGETLPRILAKGTVEV